MEDAACQLALADKETLSFYGQHKNSIKAVRLYDNSVGSALLFEARAGALYTLTRQQVFDETVTCVNCAALVGTPTKQLNIWCFSATRLESLCLTALAVALGFEDSEGEVQTVAVSRTKRRLKQWRAACSTTKQ